MGGAISALRSSAGHVNDDERLDGYVFGSNRQSIDQRGDNENGTTGTQATERKRDLASDPMRMGNAHTVTAKGASARYFTTAATSSVVLKNPKLKRTVPSPGRVPIVSCDNGAQW